MPGKYSRISPKRRLFPHVWVSTREAYFLDFAKKVRAVSKLPLLITGGFRTADFCNEALASGELDLIGMGRPFLTNITDISGFLNGSVPVMEILIIRTGIKSLEDAAEGGFYARQLIRLAFGQAPKLDMNPLWCSSFLVLYELKKALSKKNMTVCVYQTVRRSR